MRLPREELLSRGEQFMKRVITRRLVMRAVDRMPGVPAATATNAQVFSSATAIPCISITSRPSSSWNWSE